jgi:TPR repeat protein
MKQPAKAELERCWLLIQQGDKAGIKPLKRWARQGSVDAAHILADCYWMGLCVRENKKRALKYFIKVAKSGDVQAAHFCGGCYIEGDGVRKNHEKAIPYLKIVARGADPEYAELIASTQTVLTKVGESW